MKNFLLHVLAACFVSSMAISQDIVKVAPNFVKVVLDNEKVRVLDVQLKAGDKVPMHSHPNQVIYGLMNGKAKTTTPDGKVTETEFKSGEARWSGPVTHANEATTENHVLVFELKEPKKMEKK